MKKRILGLIVLCLALTNCETPLDYQYKVDNRLEGKDKLILSTGITYTEAELAALGYDPTIEEFFTNTVNLSLSVQAKPLKVELINANTLAVIEEDLLITENNGDFVATYNSTVADLGVGIGDKVKVEFKVTYDNSGEAGFDYNAVLSYFFTIKDKSPNLALGKSVTVSGVAAFGTSVDSVVDGENVNNGYPSIFHSDDEDGQDKWLEVDLGQVYNVRQVNLFNRADCCGERLSKYHVFVSETPIIGSTAEIQAIPGIKDIYKTTQVGQPTKLEGINVMGRYVRVHLDKDDQIDPFWALAEIEVY